MPEDNLESPPTTNGVVARNSDISKNPATVTEATAFWKRHIRSVMEPLLACTQSYSPSDQISHLQFLDNFVAPCLGPLPTDPHNKYTAPSSFVGTLFEPSLNFTDNGTTKVRFSIDIIAPSDRDGPDPFGERESRDVLRRWASAIGSDTTWLEHFLSALQLTPEETDVVRQKIPAHVDPPAGCSVGCDLDGASRMLKTYIPTKRKSLATSKASSSILVDAIQSLEELGPDYAVGGLSTLASYLSDSRSGVSTLLISFDCVNPVVEKGRIKVYLRTESTNWDTACDVMTLGGRLKDAVSQKRVQIMHSLWPLLQPELEINGTVNGANRPGASVKRVPFWPYTGLIFNVSLTRGSDIPEMQCYIPMFSHPSTAEDAEVEFESFLRHIGHEWASSGRYREAMKNIFGPDTLYGQSFTSFAYTEKNGAYMTSYFAMPIDQYLGSRILA